MRQRERERERDIERRRESETEREWMTEPNLMTGLSSCVVNAEFNS